MILKEIIKDPHIFVKVIMLLYSLSCIRYAIGRDYARMTYWAGALVLTYCITFWIKH